MREGTDYGICPHCGQTVLYDGHAEDRDAALEKACGCAGAKKSEALRRIRANAEEMLRENGEGLTALTEAAVKAAMDAVELIFSGEIESVKFRLANGGIVCVREKRGGVHIAREEKKSVEGLMG